MGSQDRNGAEESLPPPPPVSLNLVLVKAKAEQALELVKKKNARVPMARHNLRTKGQKTPLLTNHFKVKVSNIEGHFFPYSVCFLSFNKIPVFSCFFYIHYCYSIVCKLVYSHPDPFYCL